MIFHFFDPFKILRGRREIEAGRRAGRKLGDGNSIRLLKIFLRRS